MSETMAQRDRDLVLPPNTYAFVLDSTKGKVSVYVGPYKNSLSNTDKLVVWDEPTKRFNEVRDMDAAISTFTRAGEGQYVILQDPVKGGSSVPPIGNSTEAVELSVGRSVIMPGPASFPLWPGQSARTIDGHHLRHNQYLVVRVTNPEHARENWDSAVLAPQLTPASVPTPTTDADGDAEQSQGTPEGPSTSSTQVQGNHVFTMGQLIVIKGTEVSFYIPSTGVEVVPEANRDFIREAATLEQLEYCILLDESGTKRYVHGPAVVFPEPTETFVTGPGSSRKFRAIELDDRTGIYVKVIAAYDEGDVHHAVGEELFISGAQNAIYYPRPEHAIIEYDGKKRHFAVAIPAGEGRYVLNRLNGQIDLIRGPRMFLPDPRTEVVVRRILDARTVGLLYPGNDEAERVNEDYRRESNRLAPGEYLETSDRVAMRGLNDDYDRRRLGEEYPSETSSRTTAHVPPRTIVLDNKYEGAVGVNIWPGYAVMVTNRTGDRRVEVGPKMILLDYDETLMPMELSSGKPKTTDRVVRTVYLRTANNQVSDIVSVETRDLVSVDIRISLRANFEGASSAERLRWFDVENYVKLMTDHVRSRLRRAAKRHGIQEFYRDTIDIVRDAILGDPPAEGGQRPGLVFNECGLRVHDVEILQVSIRDNQVASLLLDAQTRALNGAIQLSQQQDDSERMRLIEALNRDNIDAMHETEVHQATRTAELAAIELTARLEEIKADLHAQLDLQAVNDIKLDADRQRADQQRELLAANDEVELARMRAETELFVQRTGALGEQLAETLNHFGQTTFVETLVRELGPLATTMGITSADLMKNLFEGTPFEGFMSSLSDRPIARRSIN